MGLLGTTAWIYRAELYPEALADIAGFATLMETAFAQIDRNDTSDPLLSLNASVVLAAPVRDELVRELCVRKRQEAWGPVPDVNTTTDAWHAATLCDYHEVRKEKTYLLGLLASPQ